MAELKRTFRWQEYKPDIGENRELEKPFALEVAVGLTKEKLDELLALGKRITEKLYAQGSLDEQLDDLTKMLEPFVRLGPEPLIVNGARVEDLRGYLKLCASMPDLVNMLEVPMAVRMVNSLGGPQELFFERLSGGFSTTRSRSAAKAGSQGAAR